MKILSLINYKGGVGKTTLTANVGAQLAKLGKRVLMVDLDPQTSLTFSFIEQDKWKNFEKTRTIKNWFDAYAARENFDFSSLLLSLPKIDQFIQKSNGGSLRLISSHLDLINIDLNLSQTLGSGAESDYILLPTKADYLSTIGFVNLLHNVNAFTKSFNERQARWPKKAALIHPEWLGIVFTMVNLRLDEPIRNQKGYIKTLREIAQNPVGKGGVGKDIVFDEYIRENKTEHSTAPENGIPVVFGSLSGKTYESIRNELCQLTNVILQRIES